MKNYVYIAFCAALCILGTVGCEKADNSSDNERGYADKDQLEKMLQGKWLADLDGDPDQDAVLMQLDFDANGTARQTVSITSAGEGCSGKSRP